MVYRSSLATKPFGQVGDVLLDHFFELGFDHRGHHHFHQAGQRNVQRAIAVCQAHELAETRLGILQVPSTWQWLFSGSGSFDEVLVMLTR